MILDKVTSLADLAFRGKTNKYYRQLAIIVANYYGKSDSTWKDAIEHLQKIASVSNYCLDIVRNANYFRNHCKETFVERPEQLELTPQPQKKEVISHSSILYELCNAVNPGYQNNYDYDYDYYITNT